MEVGRGNGGIRRHHYIIMTYLKETRAQQNLMSILFCNFLFYDFMTTPLVGVATTLQLCNAHLTKCILFFFSNTCREAIFDCLLLLSQINFFSTKRFESIDRLSRSYFFLKGELTRKREHEIRGTLFFNIYIAINKAWL